MRWGSRLGVTVLCGIAGAMAVASPASAVQCENAIADAGSYRWDMSSTATITDGLHVPSGQKDAYDVWGGLSVSTDNGTTYAPYTNSTPGACLFEDGGREVAFPAYTTAAAGVSITRKLYIPDSGLPFARWIDSFTNTSGSPVTLRVRWGGNLGTDGSTLVLSSSNGDLALDANDRWTATGGDADLKAAHVWGPTVGTPVDNVDAVDRFPVNDPAGLSAQDQITAEFRAITIAPGATTSLMFAEAMRQTDPDATTAATTLGAQPPDLLSGIDAAEGARIRNWDLGDRDTDGRANGADNCPDTPNADQADLDGDGLGDACDADTDGDGRADVIEQALGTDPRRADTDGDGVRDGDDACPTVSGTSANGCPVAGGGGTTPPPAPAPNPTPEADKTAPTVTVRSLASRIARASLLKNGVRFTAKCNERCSLSVELVGRAGQVKLARAGDVVLGTSSIGGRSSTTRRVTVKVTGKLRSAVVAGRRLTLRIVASDAAGNRRTVTRRVTVGR